MTRMQKALTVTGAPVLLISGENAAPGVLEPLNAMTEPVDTAALRRMNRQVKDNGLAVDYVAARWAFGCRPAPRMGWVGPVRVRRRSRNHRVQSALPRPMPVLRPHMAVGGRRRSILQCVGGRADVPGSDPLRPHRAWFVARLRRAAQDNGSSRRSAR